MNEIDSLTTEPKAARSQGLHHTMVVFWVESGQSRHEGFAGADILPAMSLVETLRRRKHAGEPVSHVCLSTDLPGNVTEPGVSDKLPDGYDWTKRRGGRRR